MFLTLSNYGYFGGFLVLMQFSMSLALAESKGDLAAVESFIDDEAPALLSQALYNSAAKNHRDMYHGPSAGILAKATTMHPMAALVEQRIREIFSRNDPKPVVSNLNDGELFKVQRTPDGKLSVFYNNTRITPAYDTGADIETDNGGSVVQTNPHSQSVRDIVFPTESTSADFKPKCAQDSKHFCTEVENYPAALLESILLAESKKYEQLFGDDMVVQPPLNLTQRIDVPGEEPLCQCLERLIYPQAGITKDNNWSIIVNQQNFTQGIRVEECKSPGSPCAMAESFPLGYKTECKQKYIYRQLLSLNSEGQIVKDLFKLPSCCKCVVQSSHRFRRDIHEKDPNRK